MENAKKFANFVASKTNCFHPMKKKSTEKRSLADIVARHLAEYDSIKIREPRKGILNRIQAFDSVFGMTSEELEKILAEARVVGDAKYERLQRLRENSTPPEVYTVPAAIEKSPERAGKL